MKKIFLTLIVLSVALLVAERIEFNYDFGNIIQTDREGFDQVNFASTQPAGLPGEPVLPYQAVTLLLPVGQVATSVEFIGTDIQQIPGRFNLYPKQADRPLSFGKSAEFRVNDAVYNSHENYPQNNIASYTTEFMNGHPVLLASFTPAVYNPASGELSYYKNVKIVVDTEINSEAVKAQTLLRPNPNLNNMIQNKVMLNRYSSFQRDGEYKVLIITSEALQEGYNTYAEHYLSQGLPCVVKTVDEISLLMTGQDSPEKIRNYIIQEYTNSGIEQVVLGGDVEHVPFREFYCGVQSSDWIEAYDIPSDLYFSALDGTWDDDEDGIWGEPGEDDLLPDIAVGRMPVSSLAELDIEINKSRLYQLAPVEAELNKPLLVGENLYDDPLSWGADYLDLLIGYHEDNGYTTDGIPEDDPYETFYDRDLGYWDANDIMAKINEGSSFIHHAGHSNSEYTMRLTNFDITNENFGLVDGFIHNYALIYTHGCTCGSFDHDDSIAERMLNINNFAVGFVGNSRYGWFNEGQTEGPSAHMHREFVDAIYTDKVNRLGSAHLLSKQMTSPWVTAPGQHEEGALRWCFYDCNVLGDPLLPVYTDIPSEVSVAALPVVAMDQTDITLNVSFEDVIPNLTLVLTQNGELLAVVPVDASGDVVITIPQLTADENITLTVTGYNVIPQTHEITVDASSGENTGVNAVTKLTGNYPNPFNPNTSISFNLKSSEDVNIDVYNVLGQKIDTIANGYYEAGNHNVDWDGEDGEGRPVASGVYFYKMKAGRYTSTKKMILMK